MASSNKWRVVRVSQGGGECGEQVSVICKGEGRDAGGACMPLWGGSVHLWQHQRGRAGCALEWGAAAHPAAAAARKSGCGGDRTKGRAQVRSRSKVGPRGLHATKELATDARPRQEPGTNGASRPRKVRSLLLATKWKTGGGVSPRRDSGESSAEMRGGAAAAASSGPVPARRHMGGGLAGWAKGLSGRTSALLRPTP